MLRSPDLPFAVSHLEDVPYNLGQLYIAPHAPLKESHSAQARSPNTLKDSSSLLTFALSASLEQQPRTAGRRYEPAGVLSRS